MGTSESTYGIPEENMLSFLPDFIFQTITQIRPAFLREHGIRLLLMDFDNTMLPDRPAGAAASGLDRRDAGCRHHALHRLQQP